MKPTIKIVLDADIPVLGLAANSSVSFMDGLPTVDDGLAFYVSQLTQLESTIYEAKYTNINFADLIPVDTNYPEWADNWEYISYDAVTLGKFIGSSADDLPKIGLNANKSTVPIGYAGNMYDYSLDELRKSQQLRIPIDATKARMAFRGAQEHTQRVAYFGDSSRGMTGLFNNPNLTLDSTAIDYATASGNEVIADLNGVGIAVWTTSANVHVPNVWVIDDTRYAILTERRMDTGTDTSLYEYFMRNNIYTSLTGQRPRLEPRIQLRTAGTGGIPRMMAYELNGENLGMVNPIPWRALAPQMKGLNIEVPCEYKISGVEFRFPFSGRYRDSTA